MRKRKAFFFFIGMKNYIYLGGQNLYSDVTVYLVLDLVKG